MDEILKENLLDQLERISRAAEKCELDFHRLTSVSGDITSISSFLGISSPQAIFFSVITDLSLQRIVSLEGLSKHISCSVLKLVTHMKDIEHLEKRGYVKRSVRKRGRRPAMTDIGFQVPAYVVDALLHGDTSKLEAATMFDLPSFLKQVSDIIDEREENTIPTSKVLEEVEFLISANSNLPFVKYVEDGL
ncbi:hypothetical protein EG830_14990, partial [bacterium]|nr:hypothetical protein [bacterium]